MESLERILEMRKMERRKTLTTMEAGTLKPAINCEICRDSLFVLNENGRYKHCICVEKKRIEALWQNFGVSLNNIKKIGDYRPYDELTQKLKLKSIEYIKSFENGNNQHSSFGILGQSGAGKSHISIGIGGALIEMGLKVVYMPYIEGMRELKSNVLDEEYYEKVKNRFGRADVLIIDDLFKDKIIGGKVLSKLSEVDMRHLYPILNYRYNNGLPTVFSSECSIEEILSLDEALGGRIIECCRGNIFYFRGSEYNYRVRKTKVY